MTGQRSPKAIANAFTTASIGSSVVWPSPGGVEAAGDAAGDKVQAFQFTAAGIPVDECEADDPRNGWITLSESATRFR